MLYADGVRVEIISTGHEEQPASFDQGLQLHVHRSFHLYSISTGFVSVPVGESITIRVSFLPGYVHRSARGVCVKVGIGNEYSEDSHGQSWWIPKGCLSTSRVGEEHEFAVVTSFKDDGSIEATRDIRAPEQVKDTIPESDLHRWQIKGLPEKETIVVTIRRGHLLTDLPGTEEERSPNDPPKSLLDCERDSVKIINPDWFKPLRGSVGEPMYFAFRNLEEMPSSSLGIDEATREKHDRYNLRTNLYQRYPNLMDWVNRDSDRGNHGWFLKQPSRKRGRKRNDQKRTSKRTRTSSSESEDWPDSDSASLASFIATDESSDEDVWEDEDEEDEDEEDEDEEDDAHDEDSEADKDDEDTISSPLETTPPVQGTLGTELHRQFRGEMPSIGKLPAASAIAQGVSTPAKKDGSDHSTNIPEANTTPAAIDSDTPRSSAPEPPQWCPPSIRAAAPSGDTEASRPKANLRPPTAIDLTADEDADIADVKKEQNLTEAEPAEKPPEVVDESEDEEDLEDELREIQIKRKLRAMKKRKAKKVKGER